MMSFGCYVNASGGKNAAVLIERLHRSELSLMPPQERVLGCSQIRKAVGTFLDKAYQRVVHEILNRLRVWVGGVEQQLGASKARRNLSRHITGSSTTRCGQQHRPCLNELCDRNRASLVLRPITRIPAGVSSRYQGATNAKKSDEKWRQCAHRINKEIGTHLAMHSQKSIRVEQSLTSTDRALHKLALPEAGEANE